MKKTPSWSELDGNVIQARNIIKFWKSTTEGASFDRDQDPGGFVSLGGTFEGFGEGPDSHLHPLVSEAPAPEDPALGEPSTFWGYQNFDPCLGGEVFWGLTSSLLSPLTDQSNPFVRRYLSILDSKSPSSSTQRTSLPDFQEPSLPAFQKLVHEIQKKISQGEISKAVPFQWSVRPAPPLKEEKAQWFLRCAHSPPPLIGYGLWRDSIGVMGATPEILFWIRGSRLKTMALAGTLIFPSQEKCPFSSSSSPPTPAILLKEFLKDPKEIHEHHLVVEDIAAQLELLGGEVRRSPTRCSILPTLAHLRTDFEVQLSSDFLSLSLLDQTLEALRILHPTPALGISPRVYGETHGYSWLTEKESRPSILNPNLESDTTPEFSTTLKSDPVIHRGSSRGFSGCPLFFQLGVQEVVALVSIRNVQWDAVNTRVGAGCGIVAQSHWDQEWLECKAKRRSIMDWAL